MKTNLLALASLVLVSALAANGQTAASSSTATKAGSRKGRHVRVVKATKPTVQKQIESLRADMQAQMQTQKSQIDALQQQLAASQAQLTQAQQSAQSAMQQASDALATQQAATAQNTQAVTTLQSAVTDLNANTQSMASTMQADQTATKKAIEHPDVLHYKDVTLSPNGSFVAFETVNRTKATASDVPTPFSAIPLSAADAGHLGEFFATGRQSRIALSVEGKLANATLRGYYAMDFLGTGVTSNNNQSNSYVMRQREVWGQAQLNNGLVLTGGQMWSLATEYTKGLLNKAEAVPLTIDSNYQTGFVWARQPGFRVVDIINPHLSAGFSIEQAQTLAPGCSATGTQSTAMGAPNLICPVNYLAGAVGTSGGLYNSAGAPGAVNVSGTAFPFAVDAFNAPVTTYSYNYAPDLVAKIAYDSTLLHAEVFGIERTFRNRVYPNVNGETGKVINTAVAAGSTAYNDITVGGGGGASIRLHLLKKIDLGVKGLYGDGTNRYGTTQLADVTLRPTAQFALLHGGSAMAFMEANPTPRIQFYTYYGGDYAGRRIFQAGNGFLGYGLRTLATSGCGTEPAPGDTVNGGTTGSTNGFSPSNPGSCAVNNKDVQEGTAGIWYDYYRGPKGRLRSGFQYSYIERNFWSGANGFAPKAIDQLIETSFRYYLPQ